MVLTRPWDTNGFKKSCTDISLFGFKRNGSLVETNNSFFFILFKEGEGGRGKSFLLLIMLLKGTSTKNLATYSHGICSFQRSLLPAIR